MNERIRELWDKAATASAVYPSGQKNSWETQVNFMEKFAELIVAECVKVVDDMADPEDSERYFWAIQNASKEIKEHFGVEE